MSQRVDHVTGQPARDGRKLYIAFDEWNVWYRARGDSQRGRRILEEHYNLEDALVVAGFLNSLVNHADVVKIANLAQLVNVIAPIFTNDKGLFLQTIYYPLQLFSRNVKGNSLDLLVDSPTYKSQALRQVPYIDASASHGRQQSGGQCRQPPPGPGHGCDDRAGGQELLRRGRGLRSQRSRHQGGK